MDGPVTSPSPLDACALLLATGANDVPGALLTGA